LGVAEPNGRRPDPVRAQLLRQPDISDLFAVAHLHPGPARGHGIEALDERPGEQAIPLSVDEEDEDVQEQGADGIGIVGAGAQADRSLACQFRPFAAGQIGQDEQRLPDIGGAVVQGLSTSLHKFTHVLQAARACRGCAGKSSR